MLLVQFCRNENSSCLESESVKRVKSVSSCPTSKDKWDSAARKKNCSKLAALQNCTVARDDFVYHCVINGYGNETLEVCAVKRIIIGLCTEFNVFGGIIQTHRSSPCNATKFPRCDEIYSSSDAYQYPGCYELVARKRVHGTERKNKLTLPAILIPVAVVICVVIAIVLLCRKVKRNRQHQKSKENKSVEQIPFMEKDFDTTDVRVRGETLRQLVRENESSMRKKMKKIEDDSKTFFQPYDKIMGIYVKTPLTKECIRKVQETGVLILTGIQGSGKTSTIIHIMNSFKGWTKLKCTSWTDLLAFDFLDKTLIYIDNIFDGYFYHHELQKWWYSLGFFYTEYLKRQRKVYLLITAKDNAFEKASAHNKTKIDFLDEHFFVKAEMFPLSSTDKDHILEKHFGLATQEKNIPRPFVSKNLKTCIYNHNGPIGFPLCAHLYAFENRPNEKDESIFNNTKAYVRKRVAYIIDEDNEYRVKTLLLILLFYHSPPGSNYVLDLKYRTECMEFLQQNCFKDWIDKMGPLSTENLHEVANELERSLFLKHLTMHQVYLDGIRDYFLKEHWEVAVANFPLDMLRSGEFQNMSLPCSKKVMERFKKEIFRKMISQTLSSKIFEDPEFEKEFCNAMEKEKALEKILLIPDEGSAYRFPIIFWANTYGLKTLSKKLWNVVEKKEKEEVKRKQFFFAMFGECCKIDNSFIECISSKETSWDNLTSENKTILHLLISSEMSDYDVYRCLVEIIQNTPYNGIVDKDLFVMALTHRRSSRLACIIEILNRMDNESDITISEEIAVCPLKSTLWKLEWVVRISIILAYNDVRTGHICVNFVAENKDRCLEELLDQKTIRKQSDLVHLIKSCIDMYKVSLPSSSREKWWTDKLHFRENVNQELVKYITKAIQMLSKLDTLS